MRACRMTIGRGFDWNEEHWAGRINRCVCSTVLRLSEHIELAGFGTWLMNHTFNRRLVN